MDIMDKVAAGVSGGVSKKTLDEALESYSSMGYRNFEVWLYGGRGSTFDISKGVDFYLEKGRQYGLGFSSLHLPAVEGTDDDSFKAAVDGALFAEALGIRTVDDFGKRPGAVLDSPAVRAVDVQNTGGDAGIQRG